MSAEAALPETFPMRVASRLTGVSPERMRAWETRYGAIQPARSAGGTRRYSQADLDRLTLLREVVEAGRRIGDVAKLDSTALEEVLRALRSQVGSGSGFATLIDAVDGLESSRLRRLLAERFGELDAARFAREGVLPLAREIGDRWRRGETTIAAEHFATSILRSMLVAELNDTNEAAGRPKILFGAISGERHDLGILAAALAAQEQGAHSIFLGADLPAEEVLVAARATRAEAVALGFVTSPPEAIERSMSALRKSLSPKVSLWIGGNGIHGCAPIRGVDRIERIEQVDAFALELVGEWA